MSGRGHTVYGHRKPSTPFQALSKKSRQVITSNPSVPQLADDLRWIPCGRARNKATTKVGKSVYSGTFYSTIPRARAAGTVVRTTRKPEPSKRHRQYGRNGPPATTATGMHSTTPRPRATPIGHDTKRDSRRWSTAWRRVKPSQCSATKNTSRGPIGVRASGGRRPYIRGGVTPFSIHLFFFLRISVPEVPK